MGIRGGIQANKIPALSRQKLNQDMGNLTSPYQTFQKNIVGKTGSVNMKDQRATINLPSTRIQQSYTTSTVEAYIGAPEKGGKQAE